MGDFSKFKAMSFDCYGTLIDWEAGLLTALRPWIKSEGVPFGDDEILAAFSEAEPKAEAANPEALYPDILRALLPEMASALGIRSTMMDQARLAVSVGDWPAFPDTVRALDRLGSHYRLIILSNIDRASFSKTNKRLGVVFDGIYTAEDIGSYKPDPRNFEYLLAQAESDFGLEKKDILHVAQSLYHDHAPAKKMGLETCWIDRRDGRDASGATKKPKAKVKPDHTFKTLAELADAAGV